MTTVKSIQRDPRSWFDWLFVGIIGRKPCPSFLGNYQGKRHQCSYLRGHRQKHRDETTGVAWGYGDNWLEEASD